MMKFKEVFKRYINDEFPPKYVFCIFNSALKIIEIDQLDAYEEQYKFLHRDNDGKIPVLGVR